MFQSYVQFLDNLIPRLISIQAQGTTQLFFREATDIHIESASFSNKWRETDPIYQHSMNNTSKTVKKNWTSYLKWFFENFSFLWRQILENFQ